MIDESKNNENKKITEDEFREFLFSMGKKRWNILLQHAEKNNKNKEKTRNGSVI